MKEKEIPARTYEQFGGFDKEHHVQDKDLILAYTDGIVDNMHIEDIIKCVNTKVQKKDSIEELEEATYCILLKSYEHSIDADYESPYWKWKKD